jgi:PKD repeat protein
MRHLKPRLVLLTALIVVAAGACFFFSQTSQPVYQKDITISKPDPKTTPSPPAPAREGSRRDADYWPQSAHPIALRTRKIIPSFDLEEEMAADDVAVYLVQFGGPLDAKSLQTLSIAGVKILLPTVAGAYHARASHAALQNARANCVPRVLGWARLNPDDKLLPAVRLRGEPPAGAAAYRLELYPGANLAAVRQETDRCGGRLRPLGQNACEVIGCGTLDFALKLAAIRDVYAIDLPRPALKASNQAAATASRIPVAQGAPRNLSGAGVTVMVRDEGASFAHTDLLPRLALNTDIAVGPTSQHTTHICGTIGGSGTLNAAARGMAYGCNLIVYDLLGDDVNEPLNAKSAYGAALSNHSYNFITGWDSGVFTNNQNTFGTYGSFARNWDSIIQSDGLLIVKSAGNDRNDSGAGFPHDGALASDGEYYDTIDASTTGKNILCVGAASDAALAGTPSASQLVYPSSSSGPCDDGRVRPELLANGDSVLSCNNSTSAGLEYTALSGTSSACAVVTGASALFLQRYKQVFGSGAVCAPEYLRALFAHTATDLGRAGPDYLHGFGLLDLDTALNLFDADNGMGTRLASRTLSSTVPERFFALSSDGVTPIKATLCWTDVPGDLLAAKALVNDLDLRLIRVSDQGMSRPFVLNPAAPQLAATTGVNTVDTIEQVILQAPAAGNYLLAVRGGALSSSTPFTLASSHTLVENLAPLAKMTPSKTSGPPPLSVTFDASASSDPDGSIASYVWDFGDTGMATGALVTHSYNTGNFTARLTVFDNQGASATTTVAIGVANLPPKVVLGLSPENGLPPLSVLLTSAGSVDPDGSIASYAWNFGDGATGSGATVAHTYASQGLYSISLTATDNGGSIVSKTGSVFVGQEITPSSCGFKLNFAKAGTDRFSFMTRALGVPPTLSTTGLAGQVGIGDTIYTFTLDDKGRFKSAPLAVQLLPAKGLLKVTVSRTVLAGALANSGAANTDAVKTPLRVPFAFSLQNGMVFGTSGIPVLYTAKMNRAGSGKLDMP